MDRQPITREGYEKVRDEIERLENDEMPKIAAAIAEARAEGDLSENAEYHGQRERQGMLQMKIGQLKGKLAGCYIVDKKDMPKGVVVFGCTVTVKDLEYGDEERYEFVGPGEEDYDCEPMKILTGSPLAKAMIGKKVGEKAIAETPNGTVEYEIAAIEDAA